MKITLTLNIEGNEVSRDFKLDEIEDHNWQEEVEDMQFSICHIWQPLKDYGDGIQGRRCRNCGQTEFKVDDEWYDEENDIFNVYPSDHYHQDPVKA